MQNGSYTQKRDVNYIEIPRDSYTAFRVKYCDALELYNTSTVISLGSIPHYWLLDKKSVLLAKIYRFRRLNSDSKQNVTNPEHSALHQFENAVNKMSQESMPDTLHDNIKDFIFKGLTKNHLSNGENEHVADSFGDSIDKFIESNIHLLSHELSESKLKSFILHLKSEKEKNNNSIYTSDNQPNESNETSNSKFCEIVNEFANSESNTTDENEEDDDFKIQPYLSEDKKMIDHKKSNARHQQFNDSKKNKTDAQLNKFYQTTNDEKQKIIDKEINEAMILLQKNRSKKKNIEVTKSSETLIKNSDSCETDTSSFVTASDISDDDLINANDKTAEIPPATECFPTRVSFKTTLNTGKKVTFTEPQKMVPASSIYTLKSTRLPLDKQSPMPFEHNNRKLNNENDKNDHENPTENTNNNNYDDNKNNKTNNENSHNDIKLQGILDHNINEAYTDIDDEVMQTYNLLKTKTLGARLGVSHEINRFERRRQYKKLFQKFQTGDIIKMEKMLVLVTKIEKFKLNKDAKKSSRIVERWREYIIVVRATNNVEYPAVIQFFRTNKVFRKEDESNLLEEVNRNILETKYPNSAEDDTLTTDLNSQAPGDFFDASDSENDGDISEENKDYESDDDNETSFEEDAKIGHSHKSKKSFLKRKKEKIKRFSFGQKNKMMDVTHSTIKKEKFLHIHDNASDRHYQFSLVLSIHDTSISFANFLDKSIRISRDKKNSTVNYTLLPHSTSSAIVWYSFLRQLLSPKTLGKNKTNAFLISIPAINISFTFMGINSLYKAYKEEGENKSKFVKLGYKPTGYYYPKLPTFEKLLDLILEQILKLEKSGKLPQIPEYQYFIKKLKNDRTFLALSFRKYDRLEWILGENELIVQTLWTIFGSNYELELREFQHETHYLCDRSLIEPLPIEGFVAKLTDRSGNLKTKLGGHHYRLFYAFSVENLLFLQDFYHAVPIFPNSEENEDFAYNFITPAGDVTNLPKLEKASKFNSTVYQSTPFPRTAHHIEWLKPGITQEEYSKYDANALYHAERRACMLSNAHAVIDLCNIIDIKLVPRKEISFVTRTAASTVWKHPKGKKTVSNMSGKSDFHKFAKKVELNDDDEYVETCLDLVMSSGVILRLQTETKTVRDEWAKNLSKLAEYWTIKKEEDLARHVLLKQMNLKLMNTENDNYESTVANENNNFLNKWELANAYTDSQLYSISTYSLDKPVLFEGYIYCKKFKSKQFYLFHAVLSPGFLVLYLPFNRSSRTKVAKNCAYHRKFATISLAECYVFSSVGKVTGDVNTKLFSNPLNGYSGLPRVYNDGWRSTESKQKRSFTLWFGSKKTMVQNIKKKTGVNINNSEIRSKYDDINITGESEAQTMNIPHRKTSENNSTKLSNLKNKFRKLDITKDKKDGENDSKSDFNFKDESKSIIDFAITSDSETETDIDHDEENETDFDTDYESEEDDQNPETDSKSGNSDNLFQKNELSSGKRHTTRALIKSANRLGVTGRAILFLARSRIERDIWVTRIMTEIERFSSDRHKDIELV